MYVYFTHIRLYSRLHVEEVMQIIVFCDSWRRNWKSVDGKTRQVYLMSVVQSCGVKGKSKEQMTRKNTNYNEDVLLKY